MSARTQNDKGIVVGGEPRIDFLPPEIKQKKQARRTRRGLVALVVVVIALCVVLYGGVTTVAIARQIALADEQQRTLALIKEQAAYSVARQASDDVALVTGARLFGSSREVMWQAYFAELEARFPAGTEITLVSVDSQNALELAPETAGPLITGRIANIGLTGTTPTYSDVSTLLANIQTLPGYAGASVTQIELTEGAGFEFVMTLSINEAALAKRYYVVPETPTDAETVEGEEK
ncbi:PilN domain-containing protein [Salinibacterium hongtaonis]|uniref:PilN domain-containing protein n=1 Tax=Homoserinimonas hongtaonis TaxID=2079791 RepID=UPI000D36BD85|nr:PilN domain-containing protein [Salinibacterium hongtaonis]AWB90006.1 hypothetical protein C2138_11045 [Salinibacterium hongtaonis]